MIYINKYVHINTSNDNKKIREEIMAQEILVSDNVAYSQDDKQLLRNIYRKTNELVYIINTKDTGIFNDEEFFTSQQWYVGKDQARQQMIFRKVIEFGALPNTGTTNVAHNLNPGGTINNTWDFVKIYGTAKDPVTPQWIPLAHPAITIVITNTNVSITTTANLSAYTETRVILEYTKP